MGHHRHKSSQQELLNPSPDGTDSTDKDVQRTDSTDKDVQRTDSTDKDVQRTDTTDKDVQSSHPCLRTSNSVWMTKRPLTMTDSFCSSSNMLLSILETVSCLKHGHREGRGGGGWNFTTFTTHLVKNSGNSNNNNNNNKSNLYSTIQH